MIGIGGKDCFLGYVLGFLSEWVVWTNEYLAGTGQTENADSR